MNDTRETASMAADAPGATDGTAGSADTAASRFEREALPLLPRLYPAALRMADDPDDAGELIAETFAQAYREYPHRCSGMDLRAWLFRILVSVRRAAHRRPGSMDRTESRGEPSGTPVEPEDLERLPSAAVVRALRQLPVDDRIAVYLADVERFGYDDIAAITQTPLDTVVRRLRESRRRLRRLLERSAHAAAGPGTGRTAEHG